MEKNDDNKVLMSVAVGLNLFLDWYIINYQWEPLMTPARKNCIAKEVAYLTHLTGGNQHHLESFPSDLPFRVISMFKLTSKYEEDIITLIAESSIQKDGIPIRSIFILTTPENKLIVVEYSPLHLTYTDIANYLSSKFKKYDDNSEIEFDCTERVDDDSMLSVHIRGLLTDTDDTSPAPEQSIDNDPTQSQSLPLDQQADFNSVVNVNGGVSTTSSPTQVQKFPELDYMFDDNSDIGIDDLPKDLFGFDFMRKIHDDDENTTSIPELSNFSGLDKFIDEFVVNNNITTAGDHKHFLKCIQKEFDSLEKRYGSADDHSELNRDVYHLLHLLVLFVDVVIRKNIDVVELLTDDIDIGNAIYKKAFDILKSDKIANHLLILNNNPGYFYSLSDILGYNLLNIMIECEEQVQKVDGQGRNSFRFSHVLHFIVLIIIGNQKCLICKQNSVGVGAPVAGDRYEDYTKFECYVFKLTSLHLLSRMVELQERLNNSQAAR